VARIAIHASPAIEWQRKRAPAFREGLRRLGIDCYITDSRARVEDTAILLGTTLWRQVEDSGDYLLVDRASVGDPDYVSLVWNEHGRRGDHKVPSGIDYSRWLSFGVHVKPWQPQGSRVVLCGQTETYSPHYKDLDAWYSQVNATHFRKHPAGVNPTGLPEVSDWDDCKVVVTLNSSVAVDAVLSGIPVVCMDAAAMAWDVASHDPRKVIRPDRTEWLSWLAWTQWSWDEIKSGGAISHLFE